MNSSGSGPGFSTVLIGLMKGVLYRDDNSRGWQALLDQESQVRDYIRPLGLEMVLDETEGYAFLRQRSAGDGEEQLSRLVPRHQLGFSVSLLLVLLRKKLAEFDALSGEARLILRQDEIANLVSVFLPETSNMARQMDRVETDIRKIVDLGFLRRLRAQDDEYEVRRILKAFVDAQWLSDFNLQLGQYRSFLEGEQTAPVMANA